MSETVETTEAPETAFGDLAAIGAVSTVLLLLALLVLVLLVLRRKKKQRRKAAKAPRVEDKNPVYGMYYFADGGRIDQGRSEVTDDNNAYYGAFESIDL